MSLWRDTVQISISYLLAQQTQVIMFVLGMGSCIDTACYREREEEEETAVNQDSSLNTVCVTSNMYTTQDGQSNEDIHGTNTRRTHARTHARTHTHTYTIQL